MHFSDQRVVLAMQMAVMAHGDQLYGTLPYAIHLAEVAYWTKLGVTDKHTECEILAWLHDSLEDTPLNVDKISDVFGEDVLRQVQLLTDPGGLTYRTRKERKALSMKRLEMVDKADEIVLIVKAADRFVNMKNCLLDQNFGLLDMYKKEMEGFKKAVHRESLNGLIFHEIESLKIW